LTRANPRSPDPGYADRVIVSRTFHRGPHALGVHISESQDLLVYYRPKTSRQPERGFLDVAQMLSVAWWYDRRKHRTSWEPPAPLAVPLYLLVGLVVRVREGWR
jgi:hypothetical protein